MPGPAGLLHQRRVLAALLEHRPLGMGSVGGSKGKVPQGSLSCGSHLSANHWSHVGANHWPWGCGTGTLTCLVLVLAARVRCGTQWWHSQHPACCGVAVLARPGSPPPLCFPSLRFLAVFCCMPSSGCCCSGCGLVRVADSAVHLGVGEFLWCEGPWQDGCHHGNHSLAREWCFSVCKVCWQQGSAPTLV